MARASIVVGLLVVAGSSGCYLAHERRDPVDAALPPVDAPSPFGCRVTCTPPAVVATFAFPRVLSYEAMLENVVLTPDAVYGLVIVARDPEAPIPMRDGHALEIGYWPAVFRVDRRTGVARWFDPVHEVGTLWMRGAAIRVVGDEVRLTMLEDEHASRSVLRAMVGTAAWSLDGTLLRERREVMRDPATLTVPRAGHGTDGLAGVFGAGTRDYAVYLDGDHAQAFVLDEGAPPRLVTLAHVLDDGPLAPVGGTVLDDGSFALAGGGWPPLFGIDDLRAPFFAVGSLDGMPAEAQPVPGVIQNPPPLVAREPSGLALMRYAGRSPTATDTEIVISHRDLAGHVLREAHLPRPDTRRPALMAAFASDAGAGLVWNEQHDDGTEDVRLVWPGLDAACVAPGFDPIVTVPLGTGGIAAAVSDGAVYIASMRNTLDGGGHRAPVTLYRVDACARTE